MLVVIGKVRKESIPSDHKAGQALGLESNRSSPIGSVLVPPSLLPFSSKSKTETKNKDIKKDIKASLMSLF